MAQITPELEEREVLALVSGFLGAPVSHQTGQIARTFFCTVDDRDYVVRCNPDTMGAANFSKEAYVYATRCVAP
ncbi:MAG: hypothetical protein WKH64_00405 [Chloroflexia bacterium]